MGMVFCRGCGKEIHSTAVHCPHCGAPQFVAAAADGKRNIGKLIGLGFAYTFAIWFGLLVLAGMVAGALHPHDAENAGQRVGEAFSGPAMLIAICLAVGLTVAGILPGTKKAKR